MTEDDFVVVQMTEINAQYEQCTNPKGECLVIKKQRTSALIFLFACQQHTHHHFLNNTYLPIPILFGPIGP